MILHDELDLRGTGLSRREAMRMAGRAAAALALAGATLSAVAGCNTGADPGWDHARMVQILSDVVLPTSGARPADDAAFVLRAVEAGLMGVPSDVLARLAADLHQRSGAFMKESPAKRFGVVEALDRDTFTAKDALSQPWCSVKALILMSFYTSERGMSQELRYEPVPGRYDPDVPVDKGFKPLSNDWSGVAVRKPIAAK